MAALGAVTHVETSTFVTVGELSLQSDSIVNFWFFLRSHASTGLSGEAAGLPKAEQSL